MLAIRMQRTGRKGHAMFRVVVQDSRRTPTSGRVVAMIGSYDPHAKTVILQKDKASFYLDHGAQPSERVVKLFVSEGVKLPAWVKESKADKKRATRNADKRRSTRPAEEATAEAASPATEPNAEQAESTAEPAAETATSAKEIPETSDEKPAAPEEAEEK